MALTATVAAATLVGALSVTGCTAATAAVTVHTDTAAVPPAGAAAAGAPTPSPAVRALAALVTRPGVGAGGYRRSAFGPSWFDVDGNSCDTRNDVLSRDLRQRTYRPGTCLVATGILDDPYTGRTIAFVRGPATSAAVAVDHVVSLADAWRSGANRWTPAQRLTFANDRGELLAVDGPTNDAKGSSSADTWLPPNRAFRCSFVARQIAVKTTYRLTVTAAERRALGTVLATCPTQSLPRI